jgi:hypothetical protein
MLYRATDSPSRPRRRLIVKAYRGIVMNKHKNAIYSELFLSEKGHKVGFLSDT